ncbi:hypothetical protein FACS1894105_00920 [Clostridia bacterium]|nr:hypothetical protein FACS1894105_00920 [Clostridia bacterium]
MKDDFKSFAVSLDADITTIQNEINTQSTESESGTELDKIIGKLDDQQLAIDEQGKMINEIMMLMENYGESIGDSNNGTNQTGNENRVTFVIYTV